MEINPTDSIADGPESVLLSTIVYEFNVSRRYVSAYPKGHPIVASSCGKLSSLFSRLFETRDAVTLGIAKDALILDTMPLSRQNPVFKDFARTLFSRGIAVITFLSGVNQEEILAFNGLLAERREQIRARGGIENCMSDSGISHILVTKIDYDAFHATEQPLTRNDSDDSASPGTLWETLVNSLMEGGPTGSGSPAPHPDQVDPAELAEILNTRFRENSGEELESFTGKIEEYLQFLSKNALWNRQSESLSKLSDLISRLKPELRRQLLETAFLSLATKGKSPTAPPTGPLDEAVLKILGDINANNAQLPTLLLDLMRKLSEPVPDEEVTSGKNTRDIPIDPEMEEKLKTIFREERREEFVPTPYLETLKTIIFSRTSEDNGQEDMLDLKTILENQSVESSVSSIIVESFKFASDELKDTMRLNLLDICHHFLDTGDFSSLDDIYLRLCCHGEAGGQDENSLRKEILDLFHSREFQEKTLDGLVIWGKEKYTEIGRLIQSVGKDFAPPLLERLAGEESISLRKYYLGQLIHMAGTAKEAVLARLGDSRWYFLRNLIIILQHSNEPDILPHLSPLVRHAHPLVRQKVREAYLHFGDPTGDRLLLEDLGSDDRETRLSAVQLAEKSRNPEIVNALLTILRKRGFSGADHSLKLAVISSLADIGDGRAVPELELLLNKKSLFRRKLLNRLKAEVVVSLHRYRDAKAHELLKRIARSEDPELAKLAVRNRISEGGGT